MDGSYLMTSSDLDTVAVIIPLWFGQDLKSSSECHWDVHLDSKNNNMYCNSHYSKNISIDDENSVCLTVLRSVRSFE